MVELEKIYKPSVKRFGLINWVGAWNLYVKENLRFLNVIGQTIFAPVITSVLFLLVISIAIGNERENVLGVPFMNFLAPGLIIMQVIGQAFSHSASSLLMGKVMGNIHDMIAAPLSPSEVTISIILASITRGFLIAIVSMTVFYFLLDFEINNVLYVIIYIFLSSFILGALGFIAGLWAEKFDHMSTVTNFFIIPLSFLSGTFYSVDKLPSLLQLISKFNPFFYMIDGFRYGFIGSSDGSIIFGLIYLLILSILTWFISYILYKKGYKIKS